jgi:hypothetical protein
MPTRADRDQKILMFMRMANAHRYSLESS